MFTRFPEAESLAVAAVGNLVAWGVAEMVSVEAEVGGSSDGRKVEAPASVVTLFFLEASSVLSPI